MKLTIELDDELAEDLHRTAKERGTTVDAVVEEAVRRQCGPVGGTAEPFEMVVVHGAGLNPGLRTPIDKTWQLLAEVESPDAPS
jgi:hypothetical protein